MPLLCFLSTPAFVLQLYGTCARAMTTALPLVVQLRHLRIARYGFDWHWRSCYSYGTETLVQSPHSAFCILMDGPVRTRSACYHIRYASYTGLGQILL